MEVLFRVLKQGCQLEPWRVQTEPRWLNAVAMYVLLAWRIHQSTRAGRASPEGSCAVVVEPREWHTIYPMPQHPPPPQIPPPLRAMVRSLAHLGGFLARTGDGEPGIQAIWQGYQRLHECISAVETQRTVNAI
jgi:hypothetical protein